MSNNRNGQLVSKDASSPRARVMDLVIREMPDEVLVYDLKRHKAHCLNRTAALVWKHCDGHRAVAEIAGLIGKDLNTTVDEGAVWLAVERLGKAHLLEERVTPPAGSPRLTRREVVRRLGLGAALAAPVVMSIAAPTAVSAQTCVITGGLGACSTSTSNNCCSMCCDNPGTNQCLATGLSSMAACSQNCQCSSNMCMSGSCS